MEETEESYEEVEETEETEDSNEVEDVVDEPQEEVDSYERTIKTEDGEKTYTGKQIDQLLYKKHNFYRENLAREKAERERDELADIIRRRDEEDSSLKNDPMGYLERRGVDVEKMRQGEFDNFELQQAYENLTEEEKKVFDAQVQSEQQTKELEMYRQREEEENYRDEVHSIADVLLNASDNAINELGLDKNKPYVRSAVRRAMDLANIDRQNSGKLMTFKTYLKHSLNEFAQGSSSLISGLNDKSIIDIISPKRILRMASQLKGHKEPINPTKNRKMARSSSSDEYNGHDQEEDWHGQKKYNVRYDKDRGANVKVLNPSFTPGASRGNV